MLITLHLGSQDQGFTAGTFSWDHCHSCVLRQDTTKLCHVAFLHLAVWIGTGTLHRQPYKEESRISPQWQSGEIYPERPYLYHVACGWHGGIMVWVLGPKSSGSGFKPWPGSLHCVLCIHPSLPIFPIFPIYFIGSYKTPIIGQKFLYFL